MHACTLVQVMANRAKNKVFRAHAHQRAHVKHVERSAFERVTLKVIINKVARDELLDLRASTC